MGKLKLKVGGLGFDLWDGMPHPIDLRFADDILPFARSDTEVGKLLDSLVAKVSEMGLLLNADKSVILTRQRQPPSTITTEHRIKFKVLPGNVAQKWLGCMLIAYGSEQKIFGPEIPPPASGKGVLCQQMDFGRPEGHLSASSLF